MKQFSILICLCMECNWLWEILGSNLAEEEQCPECKTFNVKRYVKKETPK